MVKEFRHIASCNVQYKCISKISANRWQGVLPYLINKIQSAFRGRSIIDNVLLMQEVVKNYQKTMVVLDVLLKLT